MPRVGQASGGRAQDLPALLCQELGVRLPLLESVRQAGLSWIKGCWVPLLDPRPELALLSLHIPTLHPWVHVGFAPLAAQLCVSCGTEGRAAGCRGGTGVCPAP